MNWRLLSIVVLAPALVRGGDWPGFQGPVGADVIPASLPLSWSETDAAWSADIEGYGQSSPVAHGGRLYVTSVAGDDKERFHVTALDVLTGKPVWRHDVNAASKVKNSSYTSRAAPSPVVDDSGVVVFLESGNLLALDHQGKPAWNRDLVAEYGEISARHGLSSSLVARENRVFVWVERQKSPYLLAVDRRTGTTTWRVDGLGTTSWSTPTFLRAGDTTHLVLSGSGMLAGYAPATGKRLWTFEGISGNTTPRPQPLGDGRLLVGASVGRGGGGSAASARSNGVVQVTASESGWSVDYLWRAGRATCSFGSPIAHDGRAYFVNRTGVLYCLDLKTGSELYAKRLPGSIWATPIAIANRIYFFGKSGATTVVKTGDEFQVLSENRAWQQDEAGSGDFSAPVQYAAIALPGRFVVRRGDRLYCFTGGKPTP